MCCNKYFEFIKLLKSRNNSMKIHVLILTLLSIIVMEGNAQTRSVQLTYDHAGNRIGRAFVLASAPKIREIAADSIETEVYTDIFAEYQLNVYPNPTHGELKIELCGLPVGESYHLVIANASGTVIINRNTVDNPTIADLTACPAGIYVLRLQYKGCKKDFKIIRL